MEKRTILLVEDDFALAMGTEYALSAEEYEVRHADTIKKAGEMFSDDVSLILLDVMLPDGTGYDFCKTLRGGCESSHNISYRHVGGGQYSPGTGAWGG